MAPFSFFNSLTNAGHMAIIINRNGRDAAIDTVCSGFKLPADNSRYAIAASITAQTTFLYLGGSISPFEVIMLNEYVAESADVTKKIASKAITNTDSSLLNGYFSNTMNTAVSGEATIFINSARLQSPETFKAMVPKTESQIIVKTVGAITVPIINSRIVLPLEILAINIPTNGVHAMNHA